MGDKIMMSWAKLINEASKEGFEFCGLWAEMKVYKKGKYIGTIRNYKHLKLLINNLEKKS